MTARTRVPASMLAQRAVEPTSSVERACRILRALSDPGVTRLTDIALATGLDKTTALRLLDVLAQDGFVVRDARTKHYRLGAELLVLGAAALARFDPRPLARPSLLRLTGRFEDSVILSIPSGIESLCVDVEEGRYPIRANYLSIGSRRPLGVGAGSLALLAWMPEAERQAALAVIAPQLQRYPRITARLLEDHARAARERGHAVLLDVVVERMGGIAVPILGADGRPVAALSIAALNERITSREAELAQALRHEAATCEVLWSRAASGGGAGAGATTTTTVRHGRMH
ncbi:IclR family transcriptional regulator [Variovorax sp. PvP013]|uniref:IclR family transcriptional regulator n=1 Tax=Variovorax sp. PvP013 TaxID=3156435 RepID=UPI003D1A1FEA